MSTRKGTREKKEMHFVCMIFSKHTYLCAACLPGNTQWPEWGLRFPGTRGVMGVLGIELSPVEEQSVLLNTNTSLHPQHFG